MTTTKVDFTDIPWGSVQWTMLCTLYLRAYESRNQQSILGDHAAAEAIDRIEYDVDRLHREMRPNSNQYTVALRAWQFDRWTDAFLQRHKDARVLHLGCGLDSRAFRLDVPASVMWYDVDVPQVIDLRRRLYDETASYHMIGSSVTETEWLEVISDDDRPTLIVAEGLLMYLQPDEVRDLLQRLTNRFNTGELVFDVVPPWALKITKIQHWGLKDAHEIERWNPRLHYVETATPMTGNVYERIPSKGYRRLYRVLATFPFLRNFIRQLRFTF